MIFNNSMEKKEVIAREIDNWLKSDKRQMMLNGERYYLGEHDILTEPRTVIGDDGELAEVKNLPDSRIVDNQYGRIVDQKVNYSVGNTISVKSKNKDYQESFKEIVDHSFMGKIRSLTINAFNSSMGWLYPYYSNDGKEKLKFKVFKSHEVLPFWKDNEHDELDFVVRTFVDRVYEGRDEVDKQRVEIYTDKGVHRYDLTKNEFSMSSTLIGSNDYDRYTPYMTRKILSDEDEYIDEGYDWGEIPLIPFKYNSKEIPLISRVKSIQDALNRITSNFVNNTLEDPRNSILVIHNYDGEDLGKFRKNLAQYGAVKVRSGEGVKGGVDVLTVKVNAENYKAILNQLKTALIENARGVDGKNDKLTSGDVNEMNIQSMYNDINLDASGLEREFHTSLEKLKYFIDKHLENKGKKTDDDLEFKFNRDILMNESERIEDFVKSFGRLSDETAVENHPWVTDADKELDNMSKDNDAMDDFIVSLGGKSEEKNKYHDSIKDERKDKEKLQNKTKSGDN